MGRNFIPVSGHDAVKDTFTGAILFNQSPDLVAALSTRVSVKRKRAQEQELLAKLADENKTLRDRFSELEKKLNMAIQMIKGNTKCL